MDKNRIIDGEVLSIHKTYLIVKLSNGYNGILYVSNISDYYVNKINKLFDIGETYTFYVLEWNHKEKKTILSWKKINIISKRNPFEFKLREVGNGVQEIRKMVDRIEND